MKNALDWLVSFEGFVGLPVALVNTSPRARHAYEATVETLTTMSARVLVGPAFTIPLLANCTTEEAMLASPDVSRQILQMMASLVSSLDVCN
jgi:NAD(P)H-dependent FMN reductase